MKSLFVLCLLVGFVYTSSSPAWKENTEYVYSVRGRTLSSLHEAADQYSGIFLKANLYVTLRSDGKLQGKISDAQYAQIQSHLPNGWQSQVPESQLTYKQLPLSQKSFQMIIKDGLIDKLIVEKELTNWEANIIRSIVSQLQWDVQGKSAIDSPIKNLPTEDRSDGVFKTMEETVTGKTETLYEIHRLPKYILQSGNWSPVQKLSENDQIIEVIKSKNYTNAEERPSYHYGFADVKEFEPTSNKMGQFFVRQSFSRAILTGKISKFVLEKAYTVNKILVNPTFNNKEMGSVVSMVNITLSKLTARSQEPQNLANPIEIGDLVYTYGSPFSQNNDVREKQHLFEYEQDVSQETDYETTWPRYRRSIMQIVKRNKDQSAPETPQYQPRPEMSRAPEMPLLPYFVGYQGRSIKEIGNFDVKQKVQTLVTEMSQEVRDPQQILRQSTMNKFTILCSLVRLMDEDEIKSVAEHFYTQSNEDKKRLLWTIFLDAIAEAGTGPAFLNIKDFIKSNKTREFRAAEVVATMAHAVRAPTEEYMRQFYELIKAPEVKNQKDLNETAVLSYADLVYKVYIKRNESHNQYPSHSFGTFYTKEGRDFVKSTVIPYLSEQLHKAIAKADTRKIHVYIRALGNVAHKKILEAFEPYLEGKKQASQFQRMLMVIALDRLVEYNPVVARSVLFKIYQNVGEIPELRVVAVYQLMKAGPSAEMLQHMAERTNTEPHEQVVAAIKSAVETATLLKSPEHQYLQKAAKSAKPLLTRKYYAGDHSFIDLRDYIVKNMDMEFDHTFLEIGSQDSHWPKTVKLAVRGNLNGLHQQQIKVSAMASSISELLNVLYRQTEEYQQAKSQRAQRRSGSKWSSVNVADLLNYEREEREQLEVLIVTEMEHFQKLWSFDNQTLEGLPETVREQEDIFKNGKQINYTKLRQVEEKALSVPTEMGLPFLFTYDMPMLIKMDGKIKIVATPQISSNNVLNKPDQITSKIDVNFTVSTRIQSHLSFVTPFDHQVYLAGFDKNLQGHLPVKAQIVVDVKSKQAEIKYEVRDTQEDIRLLHFSTWPYTSRSDLMSISPVALRPNTHVIRPKVSQYRYFDAKFGKNETGMAFRAWGHHPVQSINFLELAEIMQYEGIVNMWEALWDKAVLQQTEANIALMPRQSSSRKFTLRIGQHSEYKKQPEVETEEKFLSYSELSSKVDKEELQIRQQEIMKHVSSGIKSAKHLAYDVSVEFEGARKYRHVLGFAMAKSDAAPQSRSVIYYKKDTEEQKQFAVQIKGYIPNTNGLDLTDSLNNEPQAKYEVRLHYGQSEEDASIISGHAHLLRSEARKQYLTQQEPMYQVCKKQMQEGNFQLPACQNLTVQSNFLDDIKIELEHKRLKTKYVNVIEGIFKGIRMFYYPMTEIKTTKAQEENKVSVRIQFQPEKFSRVNITVKTREEETRISNISITNSVVTSLIVPHPVFHLKSRILGVMKGWENFRPTCVIDQNAAQTFSNRTYPLTLENKYTVVMQFVPREARLDGQKKETVQEILQRHHENYVVLVRQLSPQQKELVVTFNHKKTKGKTVEINMKPRQGQKSASNPAAVVSVDSQEMQFSDEEVADLYDGFVQIYALRNGEVKVEFQDAFYIIFDGQRLKITATGSKLSNSISGLCGRYSKDQYEDFTTPSKCIVKDLSTFIQSYVIETKHIPRQQRSYELNDQCIRKVMPLYADVISDRDAGREEKSYSKTGQESSSTKFRHRYVEDDDEICFTIRPMPACRTTSSNVVSKNVPVHCIQNTKTAYYLKNQIDQGGNPDFSQKTESKKIRLDIPTECNYDD